MADQYRALLAERFGPLHELERERRPATPARLVAARRHRLTTALPVTEQEHA